jgi:hypothetical protein
MKVYLLMECESITEKNLLSLESILQNAKQLQYELISCVMAKHA